MEIGLKKSIEGAAAYLTTQGIKDAEVGIILGSGLNDFADRIENPISVPYNQIPGFEMPHVEGHKGEIIFGSFAGKKVIALAGRFHFYEGYRMQDITLPTRVLIKLGIKRLIITNAAGCINRDWDECDLMVISDHINLSGDNPLIGENISEYGERFPDMCDTYNKDLRKLLISEAAKQGINLREGVYTMMSGPSFETPAEIKFLGIIGADAVGMSSVPEAIVANQAGLEIIGISFLSNWAAGITGKPLSGAEIFENRRKVESDFAKVLEIATVI